MNQITPIVYDRGRRHRPALEADWGKTLVRWQASGLPVQTYCRRHRLSQARFYYWRKELAQRQEEQPQPAHRAMAAAAFVPVRLAEATAGRMEIVLLSGHRVRLRGPVDGTALAQIVATLEGKSPIPEPGRRQPC